MELIHTKCLAILETCWGGDGNAPGLFRINPQNFTGRRLYWFLGHKDLWVTNACRELVRNASTHGTPDPAKLKENLQRLTYDLLLVCGRVAASTFQECGYKPECCVIYMPHPAWRGWTKGLLSKTKELIQYCQQNSYYAKGVLLDAFCKCS